MMAYRSWAFNTILLLLAGWMAFKTLPDIELFLFPIITDNYLLPPDPLLPGVFVNRMSDRACWVQHIHKARSLTSRFWALTILYPDGARQFMAPIDGRTGQPFSNRNTYMGNYDGPQYLCVMIPDDVSPQMPFKVESFSQYIPSHHLWFLDRPGLVVDVPAIPGAAR